MASPISTIVVHTSTSTRPPRKSIITCSSRSSGICPCATATLASGTTERIRRAARSVVSTRVGTTYNRPPPSKSPWIISPVAAPSEGRISPMVRRRASGGGSHPHLHGVGGRPLEEAVVMLLRQDGGGHQSGDLLAVHHRLERRAERDLGLAVADVARDQPVHRLGCLHVTLDVLDGQPLVGRLLKFERRLQLLLPWRVCREGVARDRLSHRGPLPELPRHL